MPNHPSLADCALHGWTLNVFCPACRRTRALQPTDVAGFELSRFWLVPLDQVWMKFTCRRCGGKPSSLVVERQVGNGSQREVVLRLP